jgi:hypothetical protein
VYLLILNNHYVQYLNKCPPRPLFWFCEATRPETDVDKANQQNALLREENSALRERMINAGIDAGGSVYVGHKGG